MHEVPISFFTISDCKKIFRIESLSSVWLSVVSLAVCSLQVAD